MNSESSMPNASETLSSRFAETRWSLVAGLHMGEVDRRRCLAELCRTYYFPVYAHIRNQGYPEHDAYQYTTAFFEALIACLDENPPVGRFRTFLLHRLEDFLCSPHRPTGEGSVVLGAPSREALSARFDQTGNRDAAPPEFDAIYAREVIARSLQQLRDEAERNGRTEMYRALAPYLNRDPLPREFEQLSESLGLSRIGLTVALKRLRARFNELVNRELCETVDNPADLESERQTLHQVLRRRPS